MAHSQKVIHQFIVQAIVHVSITANMQLVTKISYFKQVSRFQALISLVPRPFVGLGTRLGFDGKIIAVTCFCIVNFMN